MSNALRDHSLRSRSKVSWNVAAETLEARRLFSTVVALDQGRALVTVDSAAPDVVLARVPVRGLLSQETLVGIDFHPATGQLFGVSSTNRLYHVDVATGRATSAVNGGTPLASAPAGADFGFDFDPEFNVFRVLSGANVHTAYTGAGTGAITVTPQTAPAYIDSDASAGTTPNIVAVAHAFDSTLPNPTTLFGIDRATGNLVRIGSEGGSPQSPGTGLLYTIGSLGQGAISGPVAFDVPAGDSSVLLGLAGTDFKSRTRLFSINLGTGTLTPLGEIGKARRSITDFAVAPVGDNILTSDGKVMKIADSNLPHLTVFTSPRIIGLARKEKISFLSQRPQDGIVFAYTNQQRLYTIVPQTGVATQVGQSTGVTFSKTERSTGDIDPVRNTMRIVTTTGKNFRINLTDATIIDADLATTGLQLDNDVNYPDADPNRDATPAIRGVAYTQAIPDATFTAPFGIDENLDILTTISSPDGELPTTASLFTLGSLEVSVAQVVGFDIATASDETTNTALLAYKGQGGYFLTTVDLNTGATSNPMKLAKGWKPVAMSVLRGNLS